MFGTYIHSKTSGREYCGYSFFRHNSLENDSSLSDSSEMTHGISRTIVSITTSAASSPLERTYSPIESSVILKSSYIRASIHS